MKENEYRSSHTANRPRRGPGGGPRGGGEKPKDLVGTWKKLLGYCRKYIVPLVLAIVLSIAGTVLTLIGPDKLSDMTDTVTSGISPNTEKLEEVANAMSDNISANLGKVTNAVTASLTDEASLSQKANIIMSSPDIPDSDKQSFQSLLMSMQSGASAQSDMSSLVGQITALPDSVLNILLSDIEVNGSVITSAEQIETMKLMSNIDDSDEQAAMSVLTRLPESVLGTLYTDITVDGVTISGEDQKEMTRLFSDGAAVDSEESLASLDSLPESVYSLIEPEMDMDRIFKIGITLVVFYALSFVFSFSQGQIMAFITQRVSKSMRSDISRKINRLPMNYYNRTTTGDVLSRVTNDVDTIGQSFNQSIGNLIHAVVLFFGSLIMMLTTNIIMTLTAVLSSVLGFAVMLIIMSRSQKYFNRQQRHLGELNGHIEEIYAGHTVVKAYNGEKAAQEAFDDMNGKLCESNFKAQSLSGLMMPIMNFIGNFGYVAVCVVGGAMALDGRISFGVIVAFMMYVRYFTQPLSQIAQAVQSLQSAAAAGERVFEFLEADEMEDESEKKPSPLENAKGEVEFSHVRFRYEDSEEPVIKDFSAKAEPGQKIAIVGPTGAGKTTMVNLLMRFYETESGEIRIDGAPTKEMKREDVHSLFCMVLQDTWLFEGTVRENLVYCTENVDDEKMIKACKAVGLDHYIRTLPKGYDTVISDSVNLSQGQKQQLTIARAMIADKPMLILDEATSSVDTRTEQQIQTAMDKLMENRTSFVIAHRLSTIKNADLILVMRNGDIVENGTHEELLKKNGFYAELYNSQFDEAG